MPPLAAEPTALLAPWLALVLAYLLGAVPFGFTFARLKGVDLRQVGSGNIGATNTMRALGKGWGTFAFALDLAKGWLPTFAFPGWCSAGEVLYPRAGWLAIGCGIAAVAGHCFPVFLGFKGGKGVATGCGAVIAVDPRVFLAAGLVWLIAFGTLRLVSLASLLMGASFPIVAWWLHSGSAAFLAGTAALFALILLRHRSNIARIFAGTEPRFGAKKERTNHG